MASSTARSLVGRVDRSGVTQANDGLEALLAFVRGMQVQWMK